MNPVVKDAWRFCKHTKSIYRIVAFLIYTNDLLERETKKIILLIATSKRIRYLEKNLTKKVKKTCTENYKAWWKKLKMTQINGKIFCAHMLGELILLNLHTIQSHLQIHYNLYWNSKGIFHRSRTNSSKICMEPKKILYSQSNLEKQQQSWRYRAAWFQTILQNYKNQNSAVSV